MDIKERITKQFGTAKRFADLLKAPYSTIGSWTRKKSRRVPPAWAFDAYIDAATYRDKKVTGWKCRDCGVISEGSESGRPPYGCVACGQSYFEPVDVVNQEPKERKQ